jgi:hypothetical protein
MFHNQPYPKTNAIKAPAHIQSSTSSMIRAFRIKCPLVIPTQSEQEWITATSQQGGSTVGKQEGGAFLQQGPEEGLGDQQSEAC